MTSNSAEIDREKRFAIKTGVSATIAALVEPVIEELGFRLVRILVSGRNGTTVQIMAERPGAKIDVDDCARISRRISPLMDAHDPLPGEYHLEVSTPGIDRPLVRLADFDDWQGYEAKIEMKELIDGRKRFRGLIEGTNEGEVVITVALEDFSEPQTIGLPTALIKSAKLAMTEELIKAALSGQAAP